MMLRKCSLFAFLLAVPVLHAQTSTSTSPVWFTVTQENAAVSVTLPAGTTYRLGDYTHNLWSQSVTVSQTTTLSPVSMGVANSFPFSDPDQGTVKELDILETSAPQSVTVADSSVTPATTVALAVPPIAPPPAVPVSPGTTYTLTFSNFSTSPTAGQNALMLALVNAPASNANRTWEGTQMNLTIDGVTLVCTYGQTYTDGVFTLSCTVPASSTSTASTTSGTTTSGS